jgi:hypothetical protein
MEILHKIMEVLGTVEGQVGFIAVALELVLRLFKTQKPLSIAYGVAAFVRGLGLAMTKLAEILDKVLPQKVAKPASAELAKAVEQK